MHQYKEGEKISNISFTERESIDSMIEILKNEAVKDDEKADEKFMSFLVGRISRNGDLRVEIMWIDQIEFKVGVGLSSDRIILIVSYDYLLELVSSSLLPIKK